ncbi:MAG: coproporphyrinogen dehydrogenase HemZ, partial [Oscillospiraceae bacterium]|nr:coproporphyrinogen dehydrogenase HemZ [Oscillospiraceae bacterium]
MRLYLVGHRCQYAVEQMLLTLFPGERPSCPTGPPSAQIGENTLLSSLHRGKTWATASARLDWNGSRFWGRRRCKTALLDDPVDGIRVMQRIVKLAFYDAGAAALGREPPWGALTGVRPVKLPVRAMEQGASPRQAARQLQTLYHVSPARVDLAMDCAQQSLAAQKSLKADHVSLYVGIPFCPTRCAYCSFVSADVGRTLKLVEPFVEGLCQELDELGALLNDLGLHVRTVYFGGGTPTTLSAGQLDRVTERLARNIDLSQCTEYTVEAGRPDTITAEKLAVLRRAGVNRISV